jgi:hypothetical protein
MDPFHHSIKTVHGELHPQTVNGPENGHTIDGIKIFGSKLSIYSTCVDHGQGQQELPRTTRYATIMPCAEGETALDMTSRKQ